MNPMEAIRALVSAIEAVRRSEQVTAKLALEEMRALRGKLQDAEARAAIAEAYIQGLKSKGGRRK